MRLIFKKIFFLFILLSSWILGKAQVEIDPAGHQDFSDAIRLCSNQLKIPSFSGTGNSTMGISCIGDETNSVWFFWESDEVTVNPGLAFELVPDNPSTNLDFVIYKVDDDIFKVDNFPRCANSICAGSTGLRPGDGNDIELTPACDDSDNNGFINDLPLFKTSKYYLLVSSKDADNGFSLEFPGYIQFKGPKPIIEAKVEDAITTEACYGETVTVSLPDSFDDSEVESYEWEFGAGASMVSSTEAGPHTIIYDSLGEKTIKLRVTASSQCVASTDYTITISDCCDTKNRITVDTISTNVVSCPSDADGAINIDIQTTSPLTPQILWSNGETIQNLTGLGADTYGVSVTNEAGCEAVLDDIVLAAPDVLTIAIPDIFADGCGAGAGTIVRTAEVEGGRAPYEFNFGQTQDTTSVDSAFLTIGGHLITVRDESGCTASDSMYILPPTIELETANAKNAPCKDSVGSVEIMEVLGSNATPYTYDFGNGLAGDADILNAIPASDDTYIVTVTDAKECTGTVEVNITEPDELTPLLDGDGFIVNCFGETASISADATGGTPIYEFIWEDGSTERERNDLPAGTYQITVTDANGCSKTEEAVLGEPEMLELSIVNSKDASCASNQDGEIQISAKGGTGDYAFRLKDDDAFLAIPVDSILTDLPPAEYNITLQDENGCTSESIMRTINSPEAITSTDSIIDVTNCRDNNNGGIIVNASGGAGDYTYYFTTPLDTFAVNNTGQIVDSLPTGNYTVFISDSNGCTDSRDGIEISQVEVEVEINNPTDLACNGDNSGKVELSINGNDNTSDFLFDILNNGNQFGDTILSMLAANIAYEIDVYDANGCQGTAPSFTLNEPEEIRFITPSNRPICFGASDASVAIDPSGGFGDLAIIWSTGDVGKTITGLSAGEYTVRVEDENDCSTMEMPFTISQNDPFEISNLAANDVACPDNPNGSITLEVDGGIAPYEYSIDGGMTFSTKDILMGLTADDYSVIIKDMAGCDTTVVATVTSPTSIDAIVAGLAECFGDPISFSPRVAISTDDAITNIEWDFGQGATPATATGMDEQEVDFKVLGTPEIRLIVTTEKCGQLTPHVVNGADDPDSFVLESCCEDVNGITTLNAIPESTSCAEKEDGQISLDIETDDITLPITINWEGLDDDLAVVNNLAAGTYTVTVTNEAGCSETTTTTIDAPDKIEIFASGTPPSCGGGTDGSITVDAEGGSGNYEYDFGAGSTTENSVDDFPAGTYELLVVDDNDCREEGIITLAEKELNTDPADITEPNCFGEANGIVNLRVTNGTSPYEYNINGNGFESSDALSDLSAGNYSIAIRDADQCLGAIDVIVTQPDEVDVNMRTVQNISCFGERDGQLRATATGGDNNFSYDWEVGGTDALLTNLGPGEYMVTVTDGNGCSGIQTGLVVEPTSLSAEAAPRAVFCFGQTNGAITISGVGGTAPYAYSMDGVFFQPVETFNNLPSGDYDVFVQDAGGCTAEAAATVDEPGEFSLIATQDQEILLGSEIQLQAVVTDDTGVIYSWSGPDSLSCNDCPNPRVSPSRSGTYFVTATNPGDCSASDTINVLVNFDRPIYFPEAFTPNSDGINDRYYVQGTSAIRVIKRLSIFDRFGALLYDQTMIQPNDPTIGWDGMLDGRAVHVGVYVVRAEVEFIDREVITYTRDVTLAKNNQ